MTSLLNSNVGRSLTSRRMLVFAMSICVLAVAFAAPAAAGPVEPSDATCRATKIHITAPYIKPNTYTGSVGGGQWTPSFPISSGGTRPAEFGSRCTSRSRTSISLTGYCRPEYFEYVHPTYGWSRTTQGQIIPMAGRSGYFRISHRFFWFNLAGTQVIEENKVLAAEMFDERSYPFRSDGYCYYA